MAQALEEVVMAAVVADGDLVARDSRGERGGVSAGVPEEESVYLRLEIQVA